jgi:oxygen-dependent protoporphyrinogen oxidase
MGARVRDRLVAPVTAGVYSALPEDVDVEIAAPGLSAALTRVGSLSGAVLALQGDRAGKTPGAAVLGIDGGMGRIVDALRDELALFGADVRTGTRAVRLDRSGEGWTVAFEELGTVAADASEPDVVEPVAVRGDDALVSPDVPAPDAPATDAPEPLTATAVVIATAEPSARTLLAPHMTGLSDPGAAPEIEIVTLLLDAPELDSAPRGSGVLTVPGSHTAKALTHSTAKWGWLRRAADGRHVVRVSFGTQGEAAATAPLDDDAAARLALSEASALLGVRLRHEQLRASHRARFVQSQPTSLIGATERRAAVREAVRNTPRLAVVGAWLAGTGLAQVVPDAAEEADRLRSQLLWAH